MVRRPASAEVEAAGRGFLDEIDIVAGLWPEEGRFEHTRIADAVAATITLDLVDMHGQNFGHGEVVRHSASFLWRDAYLSWLVR